MSKKITDEEIKLFREMMADVKPLKKSASKKTAKEISHQFKDDISNKSQTEITANKPDHKNSDKSQTEITPTDFSKKININIHKKTGHHKIKIHEDFADTSFFTIDEKQPDISGSDIISFSHTGVQRKRISQLSRGKIQPEATLDLHDHTSDEAINAVEHFLTRSQKKGLRAVCIIHGKGLYSSHNKPVLKNLLNSFLRQHPLVLAFHSEKNNPGALIVLLARF